MSLENFSTHKSVIVHVDTVSTSRINLKNFTVPDKPCAFNCKLLIGVHLV
jgi:hypothetical protein